MALDDPAYRLGLYSACEGLDCTVFDRKEFQSSIIGPPNPRMVYDFSVVFLRGSLLYSLSAHNFSAHPLSMSDTSNNVEPRTRLLTSCF